MMVLKLLTLFLMTSIATYTDIKENKIKNKHLLIFIIIGMILSIVSNGILGLKDSLLGIIIPFLLLFIFFVFRMLGAGDIKLFCAIGSIMGVSFVINNIIYSFLLAGIVVILKLLLTKKIISTFKGIYYYFANMFLTQSVSEFKSTINDKFPFAIAILLGSISQIIIGYKFI